MGTRIISNNDGAVMYDSVNHWAFGPVFWTYEHADDFIKWVKVDPRTLTEKELIKQFGFWSDERCDEDGELIDEMAAALAYDACKAHFKGE
jgi:hypothetical protein